MNKALNLISLAQKAGKVRAGEYLTMKTLKEGRACLTVIAADTSENATKRIMKACDVYGCRAVVFGSKKELGHFVGAADKSVVSLTDQGFSKALLKLLGQS